MSLQKVWYWGVFGLILGAFVSNVDRLFFTEEAAPVEVVSAPVEVAEAQQEVAEAEVTPPPEVEAAPEVAEEPEPLPPPPVEEPKPVEKMPLHVVRVVVEDSRVVVAFSASQYLRNCTTETVAVEPAVEQLSISSDWRGNLLLEGDFKEKTTYTLRLAPVICTANAELKEPISTMFYVDKPLLMEPRMSFLTRGEFLPLHRAVLPYELVNLDTLEVTLRRAYESNLVPFGTSGWTARQKMVEVARETLKIGDVPVNTPIVKQLDVGALTKAEPGYYQLWVRGTKEGKEGGYTAEMAFFLTDLGVVYAYDHQGDFRVAVYRLSDGTAVNGAVVEVASDKAQTQFVGVTGSDGIAALTQVAGADLTKERPEGLLVRAGDDLTYLNLGNYIIHYGQEMEMGATQPLRAVAWMDRGAVRPGERVMCYVMARDKDLKALAQIPLQGVVRDAQFKSVQTVTATTDSYGLACFEYLVPSEAPSGQHLVQFSFGDELVTQAAFYVSDFVPDRMEVNAAFGEGKTLAIDAKTYFGTEVDGASGDVRIRAVPQRTLFQWKGWWVGVPDARDEMLLRQAVTKVAGEPLVVTYTDPQEATHAPLNLEATVTLSEPGGRAVTAYATQMIYPHARYIGVREEADTVQMKLLVPEGNVVPAEEATLTLVRHEWDYLIVREGTNYRYRWEERDEPVKLPVSTVLLSAETVVTPDFSGLEAGRYTLTVKLADGLTTTYDFWHSAGEAGTRSANPSVLSFETDKSSYLPGEVARLTFRVPAAGTLLLCEGSGDLQGMRSQRVAAGDVTVTTQIPLELTREKWSLGVTYIADAIGTQARLFGVAELPVALDKGYALNVTIDAPEHVKPGASATVKLRLSTPDGQPAQGEVMLYGVDEGILALTSYKVVHPLRSLAACRQTGFTIGDIYGDLYPELRITPDGRIGGGMADSLMAAPSLMAKRARNAAEGAGESEEEGLEYADIPRVICAPIVVSASGEAEVTVTVPEFQGALRWMAVAAHETRVGSSETTMVVRSDATLLASSARFGCPEDQAEVAFQIANHEIEDGTYELLLDGTVIDAGTLAKGTSKTVCHRMALGTTVATLRIGGQEITERLPVFVRPSVPEVTATIFKLLGASDPLPEGATQVNSTQEVLSPVLDWLAVYPYRCTEQLSARILPYVFRTKLEPAEEALVRQTTAHLLARLSSDGSFSMWQGGRSFNSEASLLASLVLLKADAQGHVKLDQTTRKTLCAALQVHASALRSEDRGKAAFATWVLAEVGERLHPTLARNLLATSQEDGAAFLAAAALIRTGYAGEGAPILRKLLADNKSRAPILPWCMDEAAQRSLEVTLAMQCGLGAEVSEQTLATFFTSSRETTQQNAWAAVALQALGEAMPDGVLIRLTEKVSVVRPNQPIQVARTLLDATGAPVTKVAHGALLYLRVDIVMPRTCDDIAIRDLLPGGLEVEDGTLATRSSAQLPEWAKKLPCRFSQSYMQNLGHELRRFGYIGTGETSLVIPVRAVTRGTFVIPATVVEAMYEPTLTGAATGEGTLTIE